MTLLLLSPPGRGAVWRRIFAEAGEPIAVGEAELGDPASVEAIACWVPPADLARFRRLRLVLSVGAGVDQFGALPPGVLLARTLSPGLDAMVRDWVVMAVLMLHRDLPLYLDQAARELWRPHPVLPASRRRVGILGPGRIGRMAAATLSGLGFEVAGLSRSGAPVPGLEVFGPWRRADFLGRSDILVCLLPLTAETRGVLSAQLFAALPAGAGLVHAGRGAQLDMEALRAALDTGQLSAAMLDVTEPEPLPPGHFAWSDPRILVTPHVGAQTDHSEGARHALAVLRALRAGRPVPGLVDRSRGY